MIAMARSVSATHMENQTHISPRAEATDADGQTRTEADDKEVHIVITDFQLHTTDPRKPKTFAEGIRKAVRTGDPGRTYVKGGMRMTDPATGAFEIQLPTDGLEEVIAKAQAQGKRVRFFI